MSEQSKGLWGDSNPNWRGGRTISSHGYILIKQPEHPYANKNGYVYEHRIVMENILGRFLKPSEIVHHKNENKQDNSPENLTYTDSIASHKLEHRVRKDTRKPGEGNPIIKCACGCGGIFLKYDEQGRPRKYLQGHSRKGKSSYESNIQIYCACGCGKKLYKYDKYGRERKFLNGHNTKICNPNKKKEN